MRYFSPFAVVIATVALSSCAAQQPAVPNEIVVDFKAPRHPISPLIYGMAFADPATIADLNIPLNRDGGNATTRYNWQENSSNHASDWFFESLPEGPAVPGGAVDQFIAKTKSAGASAMVTIPTIGWVSQLGPNRVPSSSFSVTKYGPQQKTDPNFATAGNGIKPDGTQVTDNDPNDANQPATPDFQTGWVNHLIQKWGDAAHGGVHYYLMDNEPGLWNETHRDVHPNPATLEEVRDDIISYSTMVKAADPNALICGPEDWNYVAAINSAADRAYLAGHHWFGHPPDRAAHGNIDAYPWLLQELHDREPVAGQRLLDVLTIHYYPQGGEFDGVDSDKMQLLRNRSTRSLWDPNYADETWVKDKIELIPRLKQWVAQYYPGTKIGITEYNWGATTTMGGATTEADVLGIMGREGVDLACYWAYPPKNSPVYEAFKLMRNYDGAKHGFGNIGVAVTVPDCDKVSCFASVRSSDHAVTLLVVNKQLHEAATLPVLLSAAPQTGIAQVWRLVDGKIVRDSDVPIAKERLIASLPPQSLALYVIRK